MNSLRHKLLLGFGGLLLILVAVSALTMVVLTRYSHSLERVFRENYDSAVFCDGMKLHLDQLDARAQRLIWDEDSYTRPGAWAAESNAFETNLQQQLANCTLPGERELTDHLADSWRNFKSRYADFVAAPDHRRDIYRDNLLPRYTEMRDSAQRLADMNMSNMVSVDGQVKRTLFGVRNALLILVVAGTLLAAAVVVTVAATLHKPIQALTRSARQIESGDLDLRLDVHSRDELGQLVEAFNAMASRLREFRRIDHERLARTQQTTQLAIDSLPDAVFVIGPQATVEISNLTAQTHFGIRPGEKLTDLKLPWLNELHANVLRDQTPLEPQGYKSAIQLFDGGHERFLLPRAVPMFDGEHRPIGVTVILVDVTRLRAADELKSGLVSMVSHELRTPLTSIRMGVALAMSKKLGPLTATQEKVLTAARDDSDRLHRIIENLLSMSRIEDGDAHFQFRRMTAAEIVSQAVDPLRASFTEKKQQLIVDLSESLPEVDADPSCISLALTNLLTNAQKFTPAGGEVRLTVSMESDPNPKESMNGGAMQFRVSDSGPGIPREFASRIFEKFYRIPRPGGPSGAGLGLSIAKEIVEAHGGTIACESQAPNGSTFRITLPLAHKESQVPPAGLNQ